MDINKYSPYCSRGFDGVVRSSMAVHADGDYVLATDYDKLNEEVTELTQLLADEREKASARIEELEGEMANMVERI